MKTIKQTTLKKNFCINCGICRVVCPSDAIRMELNKYGEPNPVINNKKCTNCGECTKYCPHTKEKMKEEAIKISAIDEPQTYGLQDASYYIAWSKNNEQRQRCCSGGVVTEFAKYLFDTNKIDGMVHVERLWAKVGELHYGARLSKSIKEIENNVSSAYQPIDFSNIIDKLEQNKTYFITGTPCVIRAFKQLFNECNKFKNINIITCALICSHNTNAQFIDFLTQMNNLPNNEEWQANIRNKDQISNAVNFNNHIYTKEKDLMKKNRFESGWTDIWRSYYFAMNVCNYCSDFWGYEADLSVKDAWGIGDEDPLGKSVVVLRNKNLEKIFLNANLEIRTITYETIKNHQFITTKYKQMDSIDKNFKSIFSRNNKINGLLKNKVISYCSKFLYKNFGFYPTKKIMEKLDKIFTQKSKPEITELYLMQKIIYFLKSFKIFKQKKVYKNVKRILVAGGYGCGNTGDEAQCEETLNLLTKRYPNYEIINLTPNVEYSTNQHSQFKHELASRVIFFNSGKPDNCYDFNSNNVTNKKILKFFEKFLLIIFNGFLVRWNLPTLFINEETSDFLYKIKTSSLFYFCGGGYLTGSTLSRLWEGVLLCRLAFLFNVPVVMSGQTIGVWESNFNKNLAKWGFKHVKIITVRDETLSLNDLKQIKLVGENYFPTHDDALFCEKAHEKQINIDNYVTVNFHYWGMKDDEKNIYIEKINKIITILLEKTDYNIVLIPMQSTDEYSFDDYMKRYSNERVSCFKYDYDFRKVRRVISDSKICITMKHHPIIFAMGEKVPVISLGFSEYYVHKNLGALMQYKQEKFSIDLENKNFSELFEKDLEYILNNYEEICKTIENQTIILKERKNKFLNKVDKILDK